MVKLINSYLTESDIAEIARISTGKKKRSDEALVRHLVRQGHDSVFEHAVMTFYVECPIYTARQWMRHRISSYTEKSGRYSEMTGIISNLDFEPRDDEHEPAKVTFDSFEAYEKLIAKGVKKEDARQVLPLCTATKFYWTVNLRSLMNFLSNRMDSKAQQDIFLNAVEIFKIFEERYPNIADEWRYKERAVREFLKGWRERNETQDQE